MSNYVTLMFIGSQVQPTWLIIIPSITPQLIIAVFVPNMYMNCITVYHFCEGVFILLWDSTHKPSWDSLVLSL